MRDATFLAPSRREGSSTGPHLHLASLVLRGEPMRSTTIGAMSLGLLLGCGGGGGDPALNTSDGSSGMDSGSEDGGSTSSGAMQDETAGDGTEGSGDESTGDPTEGGCMPAEPPADGGVATVYGTVQGVLGEGVTEFLAIPFAAPPVGDLRWQPTQAPECWDDVRVADTPAPVCAQLESDGGLVIGEEDCLYLNVWTPEARPEGARPVMVFIHGGGHSVGSGADPFYAGANLAREHDVVVVTINYRLGALGYLAHDVLDGLDPRGVSGNYGLLDQLEALRWVADNIEGFGGDPGRVTVFGESAGAVSTCAVLGAPEAEGLVHGAIVQSGGCSQRSSAQYREQVGDPWIEASTCAAEADVAACLRALPFDEVVTAEPTGFPSVSALGQVWSPYVDGVTLPASTLDQMEAGEHVDVPFVIGANAEETANDVPPLDLAAYEGLVGLTFGALAPVVLAQYPAADYPTPTDAWIALTSDAKFICGARNSAEAAATGGTSPVYRYHFSYDGYTTGPMGDPAAFHGLELVYIFGNFDTLSFGGFPYPVNADDEAMAAQLGEAWTTFARTGDPSTMTLDWPLYEVGTDPYAGLDVPPFVDQGVRTEQCDFWAALAGG